MSSVGVARDVKFFPGLFFCGGGPLTTFRWGTRNRLVFCWFFGIMRSFSLVWLLLTGGVYIPVQIVTPYDIGWGILLHLVLSR